MTELLGVYGAGGCGRGILPLVRQHSASGDRVVFIDDAQAGSSVNNAGVLSWAEFLEASAHRRRVFLAIANSAIRERLYHRCTADGVEVATVVSGNAVVMDNVRIADGALVSPFVTFTSNIQIGKCFHANLYSYVEHDCVIGDFVTFAPGVHCNGNVVIEDHAYVGSGAIIRNGAPEAPIVIGRGATVGMGAVVTRSVPAGAIVMGNPARPLVRPT